MRVALRHYLLDPGGNLYRLPNALLDRLLSDPVKHRLLRFANQRVRSAEIVIELHEREPIRVLRSSFSIVTFNADGALVPPLSDRHVRAAVELALPLAGPAGGSPLVDASTRFVARGGQWSPTPAQRQLIENTALGRMTCIGVLRTDPA